MAFCWPYPFTLPKFLQALRTPWDWNEHTSWDCVITIWIYANLRRAPSGWNILQRSEISDHLKKWFKGVLDLGFPRQVEGEKKGIWQFPFHWMQQSRNWMSSSGWVEIWNILKTVNPFLWIHIVREKLIPELLNRCPLIRLSKGKKEMPDVWKMEKSKLSAKTHKNSWQTLTKKILAMNFSRLFPRLCFHFCKDFLSSSFCGRFQGHWGEWRSFLEILNLSQGKVGSHQRQQSSILPIVLAEAFGEFLKAWVRSHSSTLPHHCSLHKCWKSCSSSQSYSSC